MPIESNSEEQQHRIKQAVIDFCRAGGADLIGFAPVERWDQFGEVPAEFRPRALWEPARTVIVIGMQMPLPVVETTPSILHEEMYNTCNRELDGLAFNLVRFLNRQGVAAYFFTRDGYGSLRVLKKRMQAAFGHVAAARYAGLGIQGLSHNLLTPEYGPRVRLVSVFAAVPMEPSAIIEKDLCISCLACAKSCPKGALIPREGEIKADYNKIACTEMAQELTRRRCYPCGICTKVCPIGKDRALYRQKGYARKYLEEADTLAADPAHSDYQSWTHVRKYGSWQIDEQEGEKP